MAKALDQPRPQSTIADMIDGDLIDQATRAGAVPAPQKDRPEEPNPVPPNPEPVATPQRTGEHTDIQKMYRLTPTAHRTVQQLSMRLGETLGFDVNNSVVIRSVLRVMHDASAEIAQAVEEGLGPRKQPSTALGNEHARDAIEQEIAEVLIRGILGYAASGSKK